MDQTLHQLGELLLGSVPTVILLAVLYALYTAIVHKPLRRVLDERRSKTEGARSYCFAEYRYRCSISRISSKVSPLLCPEKVRVLARSSGLSVLYTSHNMHEMEEMSDRIIFLQRGKVVAEGTAQEIVARFGQADLEEVFVKLAREK